MNNNKKKITTIVLLLAFLAIAVTGGTLAYFTDTDDAINTFVMGNVQIELNEQFTPGQTLMPGQQNAMDKIVWITNTGANDAYVWYEYLVPVALDPALEIVNKVGTSWIYDATIDTLINVGVVGTETISGIEYNKYVALYTDTIGVTSNSSATDWGMEKIYLSDAVDYNGRNYTLNKVPIEGKFIDNHGNVNIIVRAYAIQAEGFADVGAAYKAYHAQMTTTP